MRAEALKLVLVVNRDEVAEALGFSRPALTNDTTYFMSFEVENGQHRSMLPRTVSTDFDRSFGLWQPQLAPPWS